MKIADKNALTTMKNIIIGYLDGCYDRNEAATKLYAEVDADVLQRSDSVFMVTDCFYAIAHLTEVGYETTDFVQLQ